jgi:hypothetical protein
MIKRGSVLIGAVVLSCIGLAPTPAHATHDQPLFRCEHFQPSDPDHTAEITVPGNSDGIFGGYGPNQPSNTPLWQKLRPGDVVGIAATGTVSYGGIFGSGGTWGPNGNGKIAPDNLSWPWPLGGQYALVGLWNQIGDPRGRGERIGSLSACMTVPRGVGDGTSIPWGLKLIPNDDDRRDNSGSYRVRVHVWPADQ